jgi:hypothetical protein
VDGGCRFDAGPEVDAAGQQFYSTRSVRLHSLVCAEAAFLRNQLTTPSGYARSSNCGGRRPCASSLVAVSQLVSAHRPSFTRMLKFPTRWTFSRNTPFRAPRGPNQSPILNLSLVVVFGCLIHRLSERSFFVLYRTKWRDISWSLARTRCTVKSRDRYRFESPPEIQPNGGPSTRL